MHKLNFILLLLFFFAFGYISGEDEKCHRSTEGTDFWFGFMEGRNDNNNVHYIEITVTAREETNFSIFLGKSVVAYNSGTVPANNSVQIKIPLNLAEATGSETVQDRGIHLVAEKPVNVYALNWDRNSADVALMYPIESLGKAYFTMCYSPYVHNRPAHGRNSEFLIVASKDTTVVKITPSVVTDNGRPAGVPFEITLHKGEVYQVQSLNQRNLAGQGDLTGSFIETDKPVAVYSGNYSTVIPAEPGEGGFDHLYEQVPPIQTWGREYYAVPLLSRRADRYRVMASEDNTTVLIGNQAPLTLNRGKFYEFLLESNQYSRIAADKPILVAQFSQSNTTDEYFTGGDGDPFMIILSSVSQTKNDVTFVAYNSSQIDNYYLNVVVLTSEKDNIELDDEPVGFHFKPFTGTDYSYAQLKIYSGTHTLRNLDSERGFLAYVYGYGGYESYGYGVGFNLDLVLDLGQTINFQGDTLIRCNGDTIVLDAGPYFDKYLWNTGDTTQKIIVTNQNEYWAKGTTVDGCEQKDSIFIFLSETKKPDLGPDIQKCAPFNVKLDAGEYAGYIWSTGSTERTIDISENNFYSVATYDKFGCPTRDTMKLTVFPVPKITMTENSLSCGTKSRTVNLNFENADENMLATGQMEWSTLQPGKLTFKNQTKTSTDIEVADWGSYNVIYKFTTADGCEISENLQLTFFETPTAKIKRLDDDPENECAGYTQILQYGGNATPAANYYWDYGGCFVIDSSKWDQREISLGISNIVPVIKLKVEENGCRSETDSLTVKANPNFKMNTDNSSGCDSATIYFSGELITPDSLLFEWNFGDGSPIVNLQEPTHFYADTGKYNVSLLITNQLNGCKTGFTIDDMVKIFPTPQPEIAVDPEFCNDKKVDVYYLQSNESSFCIWDFAGTAQQVGDGNDSITVFLDKAIATIRLQVEEYGCVSDWVTATAKRKPFFDFTTDITEGCQPLQVLATATTSDEQLEFSWLTDSIVTFENEQLFTLPEADDYGFSLSAKSNITGCSDTLTKKEVVEVHPKPFAKFDVDYPVAIIEHATLQFTNLSLDVNIFNWNFGDGATSAEKNPQHTYTAVNKYPVELIVESEFGCIDTTIMDIEIVPFNMYTPNAFRPDSEIPENREFMPVGIGVDAEVFQLLIFNRWGEVIFESDSPEHKWDGTTKNNRPAPMGNYIWKAEFADIQGFKHSMKGQIMLIR